MYIVGEIKLPKSADVSDLYIQCNEAASINYQEFEKKFCYVREVLYPQVLILIHSMKNFILNIQLFAPSTIC